ncbi:MAG: hypothetical protein H7A43_12450 [Verrucomicrobia bacterium]|nr:hypothetical protein [Verrucomicrobiota bacterium]
MSNRSPSRGGYAFVLEEVTPVPEPVTLGTATTGTFAAGQARLFEWTATTNQFLYINRISMSGQYEWELLSPTGRVIYETFFFSNGPYTFGTTGTYSLALYAEDGSSGSVTFSIDELLVQPETPPVAIELNTNITATVTNAFWSNRYTFVLSTPNTLIFDRPPVRRPSSGGGCSIRRPTRCSTARCLTGRRNSSPPPAPTSWPCTAATPPCPRVTGSRSLP